LFATAAAPIVAMVRPTAATKDRHDRYRIGRIPEARDKPAILAGRDPAAFQALDRAITNPLFMLTFLGALAFTGVAAVLYLRDDDHSVQPWVALAGGLHLAAFVIIIAVHEPLNGVLRAAGDRDHIADLSAVRDAFQETRWVAWHVVRTIATTAATTAAFGCLARALVLRGHATADAADPEAPRSAPSRATP
jgi:uncharacterized membrane protein